MVYWQGFQNGSVSHGGGVTRPLCFSATDTMSLQTAFLPKTGIIKPSTSAYVSILVWMYFPVLGLGIDALATFAYYIAQRKEM